MNHISTIGSAALLGSVGLTVMSVLTGCEAPQEQEPNKFYVIEQQANGKYIVMEEMPTDGENRAIIREKNEDGTVNERFMNEAEMQKLAQQEYEKMEAGQSELNAEPSGDGGMGLAGTILAVAAGSLLGNMIGNALMGNKNFQKHSNSVNKSAYNKSKNASGAKSGKSSSKKSFFSSSKSGSSSKTSGSYGG